MSVTFIKNHYPMFAGCIPKYFRVTCILTVPYMPGVYYGVCLIFSESTSFVETISNTLYLLIRSGSGINCYHSRCFAFVISGCVVIIHYRRTGKHSSQMIRIQGAGQFFPMYKVFADSMSPVHIFPLALVRIVLIKQMIFSVIVYKTIRIIDPPAASCEMELRTILFFIQIVLPYDHIILEYLV